MKKAPEEEIEEIIQWVNCMMRNPVNKKSLQNGSTTLLEHEKHDVKRQTMHV